MLKFAVLAALVLAAATPAIAGWQDQVSAFDRQRLARLDASRAEALAEAEAGGSAADLRAIRSALAGGRHDISAAALRGNWRCRNLKLGGMTPAKVYAWFPCRVRQTPRGLFFEKLGGYWRVSGRLVRVEGRGWVLLGGISHRNEPQMPYSGAGEGAGAVMTSNDAVGLVTGIGRGHARIEFPDPVIESHFDIIELKR
jgi:hypothetical protein